MPRTILKGILVPCITPFKRSGEIDLRALENCVSFWLDNGVSGLVPCGSNGEAPYLSRQERKKIIGKIVDQVNGKIAVVAGTGSMSTQETIMLTKDAAEAGADASLVVTPFYYKLSNEEICQHYMNVAEGVDLPLVVYSVPKFTGISLEPALIQMLADENKNIIGVKDSGGNLGALTETIRLTSRKFSVMAGSADIALPALLAGAKGAVLAVANVFPSLCSQLYKAFEDGNFKEAAKMQNTISFANEILVKKFNQLSAIKEGMKMKGLATTYPRKPALPLTKEQKRTFAALLNKIQA